MLKEGANMTWFLTTASTRLWSLQPSRARSWELRAGQTAALAVSWGTMRFLDVILHLGLSEHGKERSMGRKIWVKKRRKWWKKMTSFCGVKFFFSWLQHMLDELEGMIIHWLLCLSSHLHHESASLKLSHFGINGNGMKLKRSLSWRRRTSHKRAWVGKPRNPPLWELHLIWFQKIFKSKVLFVLGEFDRQKILLGGHLVWCGC